jgi:hypothetical protein
MQRICLENPLSRPRYFINELILIAGEGQGEGKAGAKRLSFPTTIPIFLPAQ